MKKSRPANPNCRSTGKLHRRDFLLTAGLGVAAFQILPSGLRAASDGIAANDTLNFAGIGIGSQGGSDVDAVANEGQNIVALCDVDSAYAAKKFSQYSKARRFTDFRDMLDTMDKEIDGVIIGTPDHTHAVIAMEAMRRGKHVYCEKPLARHYHEVSALMQAAHESRVVTQLGNQGHSSHAIRSLCEWVWDGAIGPVHEVHAFCDAFPEVYCQIDKLPRLQEKHEVPATLDYGLWLGPAQYRPYSPLWVPWNWRGWMPFGTGCLGDWVCHVVDPAFWALDLGAPESIRAEVTGYDPKLHADLYPRGVQVTYQFAANAKRGPVKLIWFDGATKPPRPPELEAGRSMPGTGAVLYGETGAIMHGSHGAGGCRIIPEDTMKAYQAGGVADQTLPRVKNHASDWIEAIRTRGTAGSHFDYGGPLAQIGLLGAIAIRFPGEELQWNAKAARFSNHAAASELVNPPYRQGWKL